MSFNWLLIWTVAISCCFVFFSMLRSRVRKIIFYLPVLIVSSTLVIGYQNNPETAGYYSGTVWFILILLPGITSQAANKYLTARRYEQAYLLSLISWLLQPWGVMRDHPQLIKALQKLHRGDREEAMTVLESLRTQNSLAGRHAFVILTKLQGRWAEFLDAILRSRQPRGLLLDPLIKNHYLQALGETGQTERLLEDFVRFNKAKAGPGAGLALNIARLNVAAFCGRTDLVAMLLDGPLGHFDHATQKYWLATSMQAAGRVPQAELMLKEVMNSKDQQIAIAAERRLNNPARNNIDFQSKHISEILTDTEAAVEHENRFALINSIATVRPLATYGLLILLVGMFVAEMFHGQTGKIVLQADNLPLTQKIKLLFANTENGSNLVEMGALVLPIELTPQPWRSVVMSAFMHLGILHLMMNMAGLWIFGQRLEEAWGKVLMSFAYLVCAIFSVYLMTVIPLGLTPRNSVMLVGASGGVMGLIGCLLGYLGWGQLLRRNKLVASEFNLLLTIVVLQTIFDQSTPAVSSECHLLGLCIGTTLGFGVGVLQSALHRFRFPSRIRRRINTI